MKPVLTLAGAHSHVDKATYARVTSAKEFQRLYMQHLGRDLKEFDEFYNTPGVPTIDFDHYMVIAVFTGTTWNTAGVYVHSADDDGKRLTIRYVHRGYQTSAPFIPATQLATDLNADGGGDHVTAYGIFVFPRSASEVVLEEDVKQYKNEPPKWQEKARFPNVK